MDPIRGGPSRHGRRQQHRGQGARSVAGRVAAEVFVSLMQQNRVRPCDIATWGSSFFTECDASQVGAGYEIVRRFELSPPFWPLTTTRGGTGVSGYGVNCDAVCIRYEQNTHPANGYQFGVIASRAEFGPGCRELMRRATLSNPAFVCEILPPRYAIQVVKNHLIDAALSLIERRGPLVVNSPNRS
jgi:hypothetical protein